MMQLRNVSEENKLSYYIDFMKYHSNYDALLLSENWRYWNNEIEGQTQRDLSAKLLFYDDVSYQIQTEWSNSAETIEMPSRSKAVIDDLLNYCREENLEVLFVNTPFFPTEDENKRINTIINYIESNGYPVLDGNKVFEGIGLNREYDFADRSHVNILGADKFTDYMSEYIMQKYDIVSHREDANYDDWNISNQRFLSEKEDMVSVILEQQKQISNTIDTAEKLKTITNAEKWLNTIQHSGFVVMVASNGVNEDGAAIDILQKCFSDWGSNMPTGNAFLTVISRGEVMVDISDENNLTWEGKIGDPKNNIGSSTALISIDEEVNISCRNEEIFSNEDGLNFVIYNYFTNEVIDVVKLIVEDGSLVLIRK